MKSIINLTQHPATPAQIAEGVENLSNDSLSALHHFLDFSELPTPSEIEASVEGITTLASCWQDWQDPDTECGAMIGGAPWIIAPLVRRLILEGITPYFAFSQRVSRELQMPDGSVQKTSVFGHRGFVQAIL